MGLNVTKALRKDDNQLLTFGADNDIAIVLNTAALSVDAELTNVIEGTADTLATAANSLLLSNITDDGDIHIMVSKAGDSHTAFLADGSTGDTILNAATGQSVDLYVAGSKEYDFSASAADFSGNDLDNIGFLILNAATEPASTEVYLVNDTSGDLTLNALSGKNLNLSIAGAVEVSLTATDLDLKSNTLSNIGAAGNDWSANTIALSADNVDGHNSVTVTNSATTGGGTARLLLSTRDATGDMFIQFDMAGGGSDWIMGTDNSQSDRWAISQSGDLGSSDALRIAVSGRGITFDDSSGADFDYVCEGCGKSALTSFECCGIVTWHDDVLALRKMRISPADGMAHMVKLGVYEIDGSDDSDPGWTGVNFQQALHFTWSGMWQLYEKITRLESELAMLKAT